jgi:hypothetical protein
LTNTFKAIYIILSKSMPTTTGFSTFVPTDNHPNRLIIIHKMFSPITNVINRRVEPGEMEFFLHDMGICFAYEFVRAIKCLALEVAND